LFQKAKEMPIKRIALRITAAGLRTAAGALAIGADQLRALAQRLEGAVQTQTLGERTDADVEAEAAAGAENEGDPLRGAGEEPS
jgi:hypothetical protein